MGQKKGADTIPKVQPTFAKMMDITISVREKIMSYNAKIMRNKTNGSDKGIRRQNQASKEENQQSYELQPLDTKKYDQYFKNNTRFYNYQRTHRISEISKPEQHYQINTEPCNQQNTNNKDRKETPPYRVRIIKPSSKHQKLDQDKVQNNNYKRLYNCTCRKTDNKRMERSELRSEPAKVESQNAFNAQERTVFDLADDGEEAIQAEPALPTYTQKHYQLMHPDWRWIPHVPLYGWTPNHEQNIRILYDEMAAGRIKSMYFKSPEEYDRCACLYQSLRKSCHFLKKPTVSTLEEVFALIRKTIENDSRYTKPRRGPAANDSKDDNGYEADVEETSI